MAREKPQEQSDDSESKQFMREIARDAREEQLMAFLRKHRLLLICAGIFAVTLAAGTTYYFELQEQRRALAAANYVDGFFLEQQGPVGALDNAPLQSVREQTIDADVPGFSMVAKFQQARDLATGGRAADAGVLYAQLASDESIAADYRDLAALYSTMTLSDDEAFLLRIGNWTNEQSPLSSLAYFAIAERFVVSDPVRAKTAISAIRADAEASAGLKQLANQLAESIDASAY